jgi:motility quorum-sensing regulator/GCU-specific mRNA interferase toxin
MEKQTPHCKLSVVKAMIEAGNVRTTKAACEGGAALGLDFDSMIVVVMTLTSADFYKSMTTHADH